jgi:glutamate-5-semialdehyde dehydrogenase
MSTPSLETEIRDMCLRARRAARKLAPRDAAVKNAALSRIAARLREGASAVVDANARDMEAARVKGISGAMLDRLRLDAGRVEAIAASVDEVRGLPDPVGELVSEVVRPNGLRVRRVRVPLGVVAMVYEARPNVTVEASALCLKAGDAIVLRGGSEAHRTRTVALVEHRARRASPTSGLPEDAVEFLVPFTDRDAVRVARVSRPRPSIWRSLAGARRSFGSSPSTRKCPRRAALQGCLPRSTSTVDVTWTGRSPSSTNAKLQRPGVCNALECLLVDAGDAARHLPPRSPRRLLAGGCELRGDERARRARPGDACGPRPTTTSAAEFLDRVLAVKRRRRPRRRARPRAPSTAPVTRRRSSRRNEAHAARFRLEVDAACVVVNASTRFHDGGQLGPRRRDRHRHEQPPLARARWGSSRSRP